MKEHLPNNISMYFKTNGSDFEERKRDEIVEFFRTIAVIAKGKIHSKRQCHDTHSYILRIAIPVLLIFKYKTNISLEKLPNCSIHK